MPPFGENFIKCGSRARSWHEDQRQAVKHGVPGQVVTATEHQSWREMKSYETI